MLTTVYRYDVTFVGTVLPGDELNVNIHHTGVRNGNIVVEVTTAECSRRESLGGFC